MAGESFGVSWFFVLEKTPAGRRVIIIVILSHQLFHIFNTSIVGVLENCVKLFYPQGFALLYSHDFSYLLHCFTGRYLGFGRSLSHYCHEPIRVVYEFAAFVSKV